MEPALRRTGNKANDDDHLLVHEVRATRLTRLGISWPLAQAAADHVDWHQVAELVRRGCPPRLRFISSAEAVPMTSTLPVLPSTGDALWARVARYARCADSGLDPDEWFPDSIEPAQARHEAAAAIAVCTSCLVRTDCLMLSLRHWDIGQHGVWGGLIAADRARLRRLLRAGRRGRRRTAVSKLIVRSSSPRCDSAWEGGDAQ